MSISCLRTCLSLNFELLENWMNHVRITFLIFLKIHHLFLCFSFLCLIGWKLLASNASTSFLWIWKRASRTKIWKFNPWTKSERCCSHRFALLYTLSLSLDFSKVSQEVAWLVHIRCLLPKDMEARTLCKWSMHLLVLRPVFLLLSGMGISYWFISIFLKYTKHLDDLEVTRSIYSTSFTSTCALAVCGLMVYARIASIISY